MTLLEHEQFKKGFSGIIPDGKFCQLTIFNASVLDIDIHEADTSHDISIVDDKGNRHKVGHFKHAHYAWYIEGIVNAYRNGDLVHKDSLKAVSYED